MWKIKKPIKIGFVGAGFMGQLAHLVNFTDISNCEVVALADYRIDLASRVADRYSIPKFCASHEELCADSSIDAIVHITSDDAHAPISIDSLNSGKHVYTEKPMATNLTDARRMVETAESRNRQLMIGYMKRFDPGIELARSILDELRMTNELGLITHVRGYCFKGDWVCSVGRAETTNESYPEIESRVPQWLPRNQIQEFYQFNNVYCHNINLARYLLGEVGALKFANLDSPTKLMVLNMDGYDVILELGSVTANFWEEGFKVYFEDGWVEVQSPPPLLRNVPAKVSVYKAGSIQQHIQPQSDWGGAFRRAAEHFIESIQTGNPVNPSGSNSIRDLEIVEEVFRRF